MPSVISRDKIYLCDPGDAGETLELARQRGLNVEVQAFAFPNGGGLDHEADDYVRRLAGFPGRVSMHGAHYDLNPLSPDPKLAQLSRERYRQSLAIARRLRAKWVIFHSTFSPLIRSTGYAQGWIRQNAEFWPEFLIAAEAAGQVLLIENLYEDRPEILLDLMNQMRSCWVRLCLDVGHVNLYSRVPVTEWVATLGSHLACLHLNDNNGHTDEHLPPGEGTVDYDGLFEVLRGLREPPALALEVEADEGFAASLAFLARHGVALGAATEVEPAMTAPMALG